MPVPATVSEMYVVNLEIVGFYIGPMNFNQPMQAIVPTYNFKNCT
jgi:hypothetical protein